MRRPLCAALFLWLIIYLAVMLPPPGRDDSGRSRRIEAGRKAAAADMALSPPEGCVVEVEGETKELYEPVDGSQEGRTITLEHVNFIQIINESNRGESSSSLQISGREKLNTGVIVYPDEAIERMPRIGSRVRVRGKLYPFGEAGNPGEFDAASYYEVRGCAFSLRDAVIHREGKKYDIFAERLYRLRCLCAGVYSAALGQEDGAVASAMVLGIKKGMDPEVKAAYQQAGISHLLAISGLHISMIGMGIFGILRFIKIPLAPAAILAAVFLTLYGKMTGMGVSTFRAVFMFLLLLAAKLKKRTADLPTSLAAAACVILTINPLWLYDAGFQLSFSAVAGAAVIVPVLKTRGLRYRAEDRSAGRRLGDKLFGGFTASLGITLAMLPFLLLHYYEWNPWSLAANLFVIPLMGLLLPLLLLLAAAGLVLHRLPFGFLLCRVIGLPAGGILFLYKKAGELLILLPGSCAHTGMPRPWQLVLYFAGLALLLLFGRKVRPLWRLPAAFLLTMIFLIRLPGNMEVTMLDVGQGECVFFQTPEHHAYLMDAGSISKKNTGRYQIVPFLKYKGVKRLEAIFVSHWDEDHVNGLEDVFSWAKNGRVKIRALLLPDTPLYDDGLDRLLLLAKEYGIPVKRIGAGQAAADGELELYCLHPGVGEAAEGRNSTSAVLKLKWRDFSALLTGDVEADGEKLIVQEYGSEFLDCDLMTVAHHGSDTSTTEDFLRAASPEIALISCGNNNRYGHPAKSTLDRLDRGNVRTFITARSGAVTVLVGKKGMSVVTVHTPARVLGGSSAED